MVTPPRLAVRRWGDQLRHAAGRSGRFPSVAGSGAGFRRLSEPLLSDGDQALQRRRIEGLARGVTRIGSCSAGDHRQAGDATWAGANRRSPDACAPQGSQIVTAGVAGGRLKVADRRDAVTGRHGGRSCRPRGAARGADFSFPPGGTLSPASRAWIASGDRLVLGPADPQYFQRYLTSGT